MEFGLYFQMGVTHITDPAGADHMLFLLALCAGYAAAQWRQVALLVTAFTVGHATTLALAALEVFPVNAPLTEMLIALSISITAIYNLVLLWLRRSRGQATQRPLGALYGVALGFGLVHGMGFSGLFRAMIGEADAVLLPLLGFNLGIETGQLAIVLLLLAGQWLALKIPRISLNVWILGASLLALWQSLLMLAERIPPLLA